MMEWWNKMEEDRTPIFQVFAYSRIPLFQSSNLCYSKIPLFQPSIIPIFHRSSLVPIFGQLSLPPAAAECALTSELIPFSLRNTTCCSGAGNPAAPNDSRMARLVSKYTCQ